MATTHPLITLNELIKNIVAGEQDSHTITEYQNTVNSVLKVLVRSTNCDDPLLQSYKRN